MNADGKTRIILVDDHPLMRDSIKMHLENQSDIEIVAEASDGEQAIEMADKLRPNLIIMDISMPGMNGLEATQKIKEMHPEIAVLVLTVHSDTEHILKILEAGAAGYLTKNILGEKLIHAIRMIMSGESVLSEEVMNKVLVHALRYPWKPSVPTLGEKLSPRELEIYRLSAKGMSNKQISQELNLNLRTVKGHLVNIFSKLNASSRTEALLIGLRTGLITFDDIK